MFVTSSSSMDSTIIVPIKTHIPRQKFQSFYYCVFVLTYTLYDWTNYGKIWYEASWCPVSTYKLLFILGKNNKPRVTAGNSIKTLSKYANPIKKQRYFISTCNLNVVQYFMSDVSTSLRVIPMSPQITARWL